MHSISGKWRQLVESERTYIGVLRVLSAVGSHELQGQDKISSLKRQLLSKSQGSMSIDDFAVEMVGLYNEMNTMSNRERSLDFLARINPLVEKSVLKKKPDLNDFFGIIDLAKEKYIGMGQGGYMTPQTPSRGTVTWGTNTVTQSYPATPSLPSWSVHHIAPDCQSSLEKPPAKLY